MEDSLMKKKLPEDFLGNLKQTVFTWNCLGTVRPDLILEQKTLKVLFIV